MRRLFWLVLLLVGQAVSQTTPRGFWLEVVKAPLSRPDAELLFSQNYRDALLPPRSGPAYLEGTVVSFIGNGAGAGTVVLSMEGDGKPSASLQFDGKYWKVKGEPRKGSVVRFWGVVREFVREPFMLTFEPERVSGIDVESSERNPPFR